MTDFYNILSKTFKNNGLAEYNDKADIFFKLYNSLIDTNKLYNLTAVTDVEKVCALHFADSLSALKYIEKNADLLDIGCGAGFPSLPIAIARPDVRVTAVDSTAKKIDFVSSFSKENALANITAITGRAEELARSEMRHGFSIVTARAVARLNVLCEIAVPLLKLGGHFIAMKGSAGKEELREAKNAIKALGGSVTDFSEGELVLSCETQKRTIILIEKTAVTPDIYPRAYSKILKKPL